MLTWLRRLSAPERFDFREFLIGGMISSIRKEPMTFGMAMSICALVGMWIGIAVIVFINRRAPTMRACPFCNGIGRVRKKSQICHYCRGTGKVFR